jgi:hypothetical protein
VWIVIALEMKSRASRHLDASLGYSVKNVKQESNILELNSVFGDFSGSGVGE